MITEYEYSVYLYPGLRSQREIPRKLLVEGELRSEIEVKV